jgi:hypothetical protein
LLPSDSGARHRLASKGERLLREEKLLSKLAGSVSRYPHSTVAFSCTFKFRSACPAYRSAPPSPARRMLACPGGPLPPGCRAGKAEWSHGVRCTMDDGMTDESLDFAREPLRTAVIAVFRENGAGGDIRYVRTDDRTEVLFVLSTSGAASMHQRNIVMQLTALLKRKVFVTTESAATESRTVSL